MTDIPQATTGRRWSPAAAPASAKRSAASCWMPAGRWCRRPAGRRRSPTSTAHSIEVDLADRAATAQATEEVARRFAPDTVIDNAGVILPALLHDVKLDDLDTLVDIHLSTAILLAQACVPVMKAAGFGRIVLLLARRAGASHAHGLRRHQGRHVGMARTWALELAPHGITVNVVAPGPGQTDMFHGVIPVGDPKVAQIAASIPSSAWASRPTWRVRARCASSVRRRPVSSPARCWQRVRWHQRREPDPMKIAASAVAATAAMPRPRTCAMPATRCGVATRRRWRRCNPAAFDEDEKGPRDVRIALASGDIGAALRGAELVLIRSRPSRRTTSSARWRRVPTGQVVFLPPGTFGSFARPGPQRARPRQRRRGDRRRNRHVAVAWPQARSGRSGDHLRAIHLPTGVLPASTQRARAGDAIRQAFPGVIEDPPATRCRAR